MPTESVVKFRTLDGLHLAGTLASPDQPGDRAVVLVHGGGVTREEGGFFTRLAAGLGAAGVASLRFDLRGHGDSEGRQEDLTLAAILNDIRAALEWLRPSSGASRLSQLGASFTNGTETISGGAFNAGSLVIGVNTSSARTLTLSGGTTTISGLTTISGASGTGGGSKIAMTRKQPDCVPVDGGELERVKSLENRDRRCGLGRLGERRRNLGAGAVSGNMDDPRMCVGSLAREGQRAVGLAVKGRSIAQEIVNPVGCFTGNEFGNAAFAGARCRSKRVGRV